MKTGIRELIFVAVMLGLLGSTWFFVFKKANIRREQRLAEIKTMDAALSNVRASTADIDDGNRKVEELKQAIAFFESKLPQEKEMEKILNDVWQMAEVNNLQVKTVKTMKSEQAAAYCELPIQMTMSGDFRGFYAFLLQLERLPRMTRITQMNLTKIDEHDGEMDANFTLSIFYEPDHRGDAVASGN